MEKIRVFTNVAKDLEKKGYTLNIHFKNKLILRLGKKARPGLLRPLGPIEIKDFRFLLLFLED